MNPSYSLDVATNVAREFLELVDNHFPPGHPQYLQQIFIES